MSPQPEKDKSPDFNEDENKITRNILSSLLATSTKPKCEELINQTLRILQENKAPEVGDRDIVFYVRHILGRAIGMDIPDQSAIADEINKRHEGADLQEFLKEVISINGTHGGLTKTQWLSITQMATDISFCSFEECGLKSALFFVGLVVENWKAADQSIDDISALCKCTARFANQYKHLRDRLETREHFNQEIAILADLVCGYDKSKGPVSVSLIENWEKSINTKFQQFYSTNDIQPRWPGLFQKAVGLEGGFDGPKAFRIEAYVLQVSQLLERGLELDAALDVALRVS